MKALQHYILQPITEILNLYNLFVIKCKQI